MCCTGRGATSSAPPSQDACTDKVPITDVSNCQEYIWALGMMIGQINISRVCEGFCVQKGSEPYLDQLLRDCRWCKNTRLGDDSRNQVWWLF